MRPPTKEINMGKSLAKIQLADETIMNQIYFVRNQKVMLDRDLAELYGVETKRLKEAVRRNGDRFPEDFMFEMTNVEFENWRSQNVTSNSDRQGLRYAPFCFTEQGVTMLSCILNSKRAIAVNIQVIRIFTKCARCCLHIRTFFCNWKKLKINCRGHDEQIARIFQYLKQLLSPPAVPRTRIGFRRIMNNDAVLYCTEKEYF
jgi:hypothetical protein